MIVTKAVRMAEMMNIPILGLVENMSYFLCPDNGKKYSIFGESHIDEIAGEHSLQVLAKLPIDPKLTAACDAGMIELFEGDWMDTAAKLLEEMKGKTNRRARFVCVIALAYRGNSVKTFRGEVNGTIIEEPRGNHGFGYDPVFVPDGYNKTFGELGPEIKDKISHRAKALEKIVAFIKEELDSMDDFEFE